MNGFMPWLLFCGCGGVGGKCSDGKCRHGFGCGGIFPLLWLWSCSGFGGGRCSCDGFDGGRCSHDGFDSDRCSCSCSGGGRCSCGCSCGENCRCKR